MPISDKVESQKPQGPVSTWMQTSNSGWGWQPLRPVPHSPAHASMPKASPVQALYDICKKTFTPTGNVAPSQAIAKLSSLLGTPPLPLTAFFNSIKFPLVGFIWTLVLSMQSDWNRRLGIVILLKLNNGSVWEFHSKFELSLLGFKQIVLTTGFCESSLSQSYCFLDWNNFHESNWIMQLGYVYFWVWGMPLFSVCMYVCHRLFATCIHWGHVVSLLMFWEQNSGCRCGWIIAPHPDPFLFLAMK